MTEIYNNNIIEPNKLLDQYKKYEDVINTDKKQLVSKLFNKEITETNKEKKASYQDLWDTLEKFHSAEYEILNLSNDMIDFPIFRVQAGDLKAKLAKTAGDLKNRILKGIEKWCENTVMDISKTYEDMKDRISKTPEDEAQLVDLRDFIKKSKEQTMDELAQLLIEVERHYELMDEYSYQYPDKAIEDCMGQK